MPQLHFPFFPDGVKLINADIAFQKDNGKIFYFQRNLPVFSHDESDVETFRMITSQFYVNGLVTQAEIVKAFGVTPISVKRAVKKFKKQGTKGFYEPRRCRGAGVLTPTVLKEAQGLLEQGILPNDVADKLGIKRDTFYRAIKAGRLYASKKKDFELVTTKSSRDLEDSDASMGLGATNALGRIASSFFQRGTVETSFQPCCDISNGGVLFALAALLANGLLSHINKFFQLPSGYYGIESIFLLLAFMALARIKSIEKLRFSPPGEWGKLLGLDRIPEAQTLRRKIGIISATEAIPWSAQLC